MLCSPHTMLTTHHPISSRATLRPLPRHATLPTRRMTKTSASETDAAFSPAVANGTSHAAPTSTNGAAGAATLPPPPAVPAAATAAAAPEAITTPPPAPAQLPPAAVTSTKLQLLEELAGLDRGALATAAQRDRVEVLVSSLEGSGAGAPAPFDGSPAPIEGRWQLLYTNKEVFRAR